MLKRSLSLILVLVMVLGMIPTVAFAQEDNVAAINSETTKPMVTAVKGSPYPNYTDATIDYTGTVSYKGYIDHYLMSGRLTGENGESVPFGLMYDTGKYLYVGIETEAASVVATLNGNTQTMAGSKSVSDMTPHVEVYKQFTNLPSTIPHDYIAPLQLVVTLKDNTVLTWDGLVHFSNTAAVKVDPKGTWNCDGTLNSTTSVEGKGVTFVTNKGDNATETFEYVYTKYGENGIGMSEGTSILDFNLIVEKMPAYSKENLKRDKNHYLFPGMNLGVIHETGKSSNSGYAIAISRIEGYSDDYDDLYLIVALEDKDKELAVLQLDKKLNENFHLRLEYTTDVSDDIGGDLTVYCDDVNLGTIEDVADANDTITGGYGVGAIALGWVKGEANIKKGETNFTVSNMLWGTLKTPDVESLEESAILGSNQSALEITQPLDLPATLACECGCGNAPWELTWTSSDTTIMSHAGVPVEGASGVITMTVALAQHPVAKKTFTLTVVAPDDGGEDGSDEDEEIVQEKMITVANGSFYAGDNTILPNERYHMTGKLPNGKSFGATYYQGKLCLGIEGATSSVVATLNGKEFAFTTGTTEDTEVVIDCSEAEIPAIPHEYVTTLQLNVDGQIWDGNICFSSASWLNPTGGTPSKWFGGSGDGGSNIDSKGNYNFYVNKDNATAVSESQVYLSLTSGDASVYTMAAGTNTLDFDVVVNQMPAYDISNLDTNKDTHKLFPGLNLGVLSNNVSGRVAGYEVAISRINNYIQSYDGLYLIISQGTSPIILPLNKDIGEPFHLRFEFTLAQAGDTVGDLVVYCDDVCLGTFQDVEDATGYKNGKYTALGVHFIDWVFDTESVPGNTNMALGIVDFTVSRVVYGKQDKSVLDTIQIEDLLSENTAADNVYQKLNLPGTVSCESCGTANLTWTSSDTSIMSNDGIPTGAAGEVTMTVALSYPNETKAFTFSVVEPPIPDDGGEGGDEDDGEEFIPYKVITAVLGTANQTDHTIDRTSTIKATNGACDRYQMTGQLADGRYFGVTYQGGYLYIGIDGTVENVAVELNGVNSDVVVEGNSPDTEVWLDYRKTGLPQAIPHDYVTTLKLTADDMVWEGLIRFSSTGWWHITTGNPKLYKCAGPDNGATNQDQKGAYKLWTGAETTEGTFKYAYVSLSSTGTAFDLPKGTSVVDFDLYIESMPSYPISSLSKTEHPYYLFPGLNMGVMHEKGQPNDAGYAISVSRIDNYMTDYDGLYLIIGSGTDPVILPLNKHEGDTFHLRFEYTRDISDGIGGDLTVYCDDVCLATVEDVADSYGYDADGFNKGITFINWVKDADVSKGEVDVTISKVIYSTLKDPILDLLDLTAILNGQSADAVTEKLMLPTTVTCACEICKSNPVNLVWTSSDTSIMSHDGMPTGTSGEVTMTASVANLTGVTKDFVFTVPAPQQTDANLDSITQESILDANTDADNITSALALPATVTIGGQTYDLEWFSSDLSIMSNAGAPVEGATGAVTMSVRLKQFPTVRKTFDFFVVGEQKTLEAMLATNGITVDGSAGEQAWVKWIDVYGRTEAMPKASIAAAWNKGHLYLMVVSDNTDALKLTLNGKAITVDVSNLTASGISGAIVKKNGSYIEIDLPLEGIVKLTDYNESFDATIFLSNDAGRSNACISKLCFTGDGAKISAMNQFSSGWTLGVNSYAFDHFNEASVFYVYNIGNQFANGTATYITQDFQFNTLPAITPIHVNGLETRGFYFYATRNSDNYDVEGQSDILFIAIYREEGDDNLKAMIMNNKSDPNAVIDLGVKLGEQFRLTTAWESDGSAKLYVDGALVGQSNGSCTYRRAGAGDKALAYRYYGTGTNDDVNFLVKDINVAVELYKDVTKEMTSSAVLNRADLERVTGDLPMGQHFSSKYIGDLEIEWATSDAGIITANGTVTRDETETKTCNISLSYKGTILWTEKVTVLAKDAVEQPSANKYTTAYANDVVINGDLFGENWHMANKILDPKGALVGEMGAAWNQQYLYVAVRNNGKSIDLTVNNVAIELNDENSKTSGEYTEIAIPMSSVYNQTITDYGITLPIMITIGEGSYEGTLILSSTDWWGAGNAQEALPIYSTTKQGLLQNHVPNENQQVVEVDNGWHLYDRYVANTTNPACVRTCALFFRTSPYENFNRREGTIAVEFDFLANNLPVYDSSATVTQDNNAYACYGVNWNFADAQDSQKYANVVAAGIYNNGESLVLVLRASQTREIVLNKKVGDLFRITMNWNADNSLDIYIDGVHVHREENAAQRVGSVGNSSFVLNVVRNEEQPQSSADDIDVYVTNIAFGSAYATSLLSNLTWDTIRGENTDTTNVTSTLNLPKKLVNEQLSVEHKLTWTSSEPDVINDEGAVQRPATGAVSVKLTATLEDGTSKSFTVIVRAENTTKGNVLIARNDTNPAVGQGVKLDTILFTFDQYNSSVILDMEGKTKFNLVTLTDLDEYARLNRESLTLWVSDDNITYTQIEDYKLTQVGRYWYLYNFEAEAQYVKAHYTHWNGNEADFTAYLNTIIAASWNDGLVVPNGAAKISAPATTLHDEAAAIALPDGIATENLRVSLNGQILFHYVDKDGTVYVRIPDPTNDELALWNASDIELANKENVYEVTYGTRETYKLDDKLPPRWLLTIPAGTYGSHTVDQEMLIATSSTAIYAGKILVSYDQGLTWKTLGSLSDAAKNACIYDADGNGGTGDTGDGGWLFDDATGAIYYICHYANKPSGVDWEDSYAVNVIIASYDMGKTWEHVTTIEPDTVDGQYYNYMLSYSGGVKVASYDGTGEGIDFVFPTGAIYNYNGSFCSRIAYSADGGKTWQMSKSIITYGDAIGDESGLSEAWIAENDAGTLVLYTRCQYAEAVNFAQAYSYDHGLTWTAYETKEEWEADEENRNSKNEIVAKTSSIYSSNTQALMYEYTQYNNIDAPMFFWGGNNTLGGTSYLRSPLNVAVSYDGLDTWRNIQNLFSETFLERYNGDGRSLITNHSVAKVGDDTLLVTFVQNRANYRQGMTITDFENYFYRTKGVYDAFESGNPQYEGWVAEIGQVKNTDALASDGKQSLYIPTKSILTRSIPYLQNGTISLDVYVDETTVTTFALQPAFGKDPNAYTLATFRIENMKLTNGTASIALEEGWNTIEIKLDLTHANAQFSANGSAAVSAKLNLAVGDYVCYFTVFNDTDVYVDEFMVVSDLDAVVYTGEIKEELPVYNLEATLSLKDEVSYNFYFKVSEDLSNVDTADMGLLVWTTEPADSSYDSAETIYTGAIACTGTDAGKYKVSTSGVAAKNMGDSWYFRIYVKNSDGSYSYSKLFQYSAKRYAMNKIRANESEELTNLCIALLNYGAEAQKYFGIQGELMNSELTAAQQNIGYQETMVAALVAADQNKIGEFVATSGYTEKAATVSLGGALSVNYYLTAEHNTSAMKLYVWSSDTYENAETLTKDNATILDMHRIAGNEFKASVEGIVARKFDQTIYVCGEYEVNGTVYRTGVIAYSFGKYCANKAMQDVAEKNVAMAAAVYGYHATQYLN